MTMVEETYSPKKQMTDKVILKFVRCLPVFYFISSYDLFLKHNKNIQTRNIVHKLSTIHMKNKTGGGGGGSLEF